MRNEEFGIWNLECIHRVETYRKIDLQLTAPIARPRVRIPNSKFLILNSLPSCECADDEERFGAARDRLGQRGVGRLVRQILLAGEEADERPALVGDVI